MGGWARFFFIVASIAATASESRAEGGLPRPANACRFESVGAGKVATVIDGRSFCSTTGARCALAGDRGAAAARPPAKPGHGRRAGIAARSALAAILTGHSVELRQRAPATDRYGRTVAHVTLDGPGGAGRSVGARNAGAGLSRESQRRSGTEPARPSFSPASAQPGRRSLACGANRIMPYWRPRAGRRSWPSGAISRWWKAGCCRSARAEARST